jgi:hypothetical protein
MLYTQGLTNAILPQLKQATDRQAKTTGIKKPPEGG